MVRSMERHNSHSVPKSVRLRYSMRLHQNQLWTKDGELYRIVHLERLSVDYKQINPANHEEGVHFSVTKKEFCRLIKGAKEVQLKDVPER